MAITREQCQARLDRMGQGAMHYRSDAHYTIADLFAEQVARYGDRVFLLDGDQSMSWAQLDREANRYAALLLSLGLGPEQVGAVMVQNRFAFFSAWLGLAKAGLTTAMVNTFVGGKQLRHQLRVAQAKVLLLGEECLDNFADCPEALGEQPVFVISDGLGRELPAGCQAVEPSLAEMPATEPDPALRHSLVGASPALYGYTSGTTGLPKAALISHARWLGVGRGWQMMQGGGEDDVFYCVLPLFHGAAGMSLTSNAMACGGQLVLRRKFSASRFWEDVRRYGVTCFQYIGEVCRYLVSQPAAANDRDHSLKRMMGAGMTADVWEAFVQRFGAVDIYEGMGATESNCSLINPDGKIGACGRIPFKDRSNARLLRYDLAQDCHLRDEHGSLMEAGTGEVGELIGMILDLPGTVSGHFEGYTDPAATAAKILHDVFQDGDAWFATGDLLRSDEEGYLYFVDRIGDTFRWKSENVSTTEVALALSAYRNAELINIYGVRVPGHEGRAGMAAVEMQPGQSFDPQRFYQAATDNLPHYAVPLFVRVSEHSELTPTFKLRKVELRSQGYSPQLCADPLFVLSSQQQCYVPLDEQTLQAERLPPFEPPP